MFVRLFLVLMFIPLQSCSNTLIGEKLENSFDVRDNQKKLGNNIKEKPKPPETKIVRQIKKISKIQNKKVNEATNIRLKKPEETLKSNRDIVSQKSNKSIEKTKFSPQPYRIILKLSAANPSAPAETVTRALRKAGVQFEVEKIERFDEKNFLNNKSLQR